MTPIEEAQFLVTSNIETFVHRDVIFKYFGDVIIAKYVDRNIRKNPRDWSALEKVCRGLILHKDGTVLARPFDKFWNYGEAQPRQRAKLVEVSVKEDGSMGIGFYYQDKWVVATSGALESPQATWATLFLAHNHDMRGWPQDLTPIWEIIYPDNRVVVNYGARQALILVGVRNRFSGQDFFFTKIKKMAAQFGFSVPQTLNLNTIDDVVRATKKITTHNLEGYVVRYDDGTRFKLKGMPYRKVHRLLSARSRRKVLHMMSTDVLVDYLQELPQDFAPIVRAWQREIEDVIAATVKRITLNFADAPKTTRKEFALWTQSTCPQDAPYMFAMLDGRDVTSLIYKREF